MKKRLLMMASLTGGLLVSAPPLIAAEQDRVQEKIQTQTTDQEGIFGSQLMTEKERNEYRERMRSAKTEQERAKIRAEHHDRMLARAKERGVKIPDEPPVKGGGMGPRDGMGPGGGMGPGAGGGAGSGGGGQGGGPKR